MTLRKRLFWLFLPLLAIALASVWLLSERVLLSRYDGVDSQRLYDQVRILYNRLIYERKRNLDFIRIYSWWDESHEFVHNPTQNYINENLEIDMLRHLGFDFVFYLDANGKVIAEKWNLPDQDERITAGPTPPDDERLEQAIVRSAIKVGALDFQQGLSGFTQLLMVGGSPVMLFSHPISDNTGQIKPDGALVAGMLLNNKRLETYQLQVGAKMQVLPPTQLDSSWRALSIPRLDGGVMLNEGKVLDNARRQIDMMFLNSLGEPQFRFEITLPRQVYQQGQQAIRLFLGEALAIILAALAVGYLILEFWIIRPLQRLNREASVIGNDPRMERLSEGGASELRQLSGELNRMIERLEQSEARDQAILDTIRDGYIEMDPTGNLLMVNAAFCKMVGYSIEELAGRHIGLLLGEEDLERGSQLQKRALAGETDLSFAAPFTRADGTQVNLETLMSIIPGQHGEFAGVRGILRDISGQLAYQNQLLGLAYQDTLTGLGNRKAFEEQLPQTLQQIDGQQSVALLYFDLDKFKLVNDQFGHAAGDAVLSSVGVRLRNNLRDHDKAFRLGGDEFAVLLKNADAELAGNVAARLLKALDEPYHYGDTPIDVISASIGIALAPEDAQSAENLTAAADKAMYRAKRQRNTCCRYSPTGSI
ncbi:sensor domain-containing diguanylate cyclase [Pseudomonas schmalbachii]|uniref:Diguanylate cyclase n=1 Tax=Pseudomonas schmalbachii TaxID=2816993 RepID=A0ABS3TMF5_9PSED|nr:diguanylate cyclase [Pseudomonas schmalbachii]MBO3274832.1 diguanylate cyclase [Pseudomonas schmalbachii]